VEIEEERSLCESLRGGDREAFRALYLDNVKLVHGYLVRMCGRDAADDLTAETFCRAWERRDRFEWRGYRYRAWLLRIAHNLAVSRARRNREVTGIPLEPLPDDGRPTDLAVLDRAAAEAVRAAILRLPDLQRDVVRLRFELGLPAVEVAAILSCSAEAVRAATHRALRQLRRELGDLR